MVPGQARIHVLATVVACRGVSWDIKRLLSGLHSAFVAEINKQAAMKGGVIV